MKHMPLFTPARLAGTIALALLAAGASLLVRQHAADAAPSAAAAAGPVATVSVAPAFRGALPLTVTAWGDVAPWHVESLGLQRAGQLIALQAVVGQRVGKGTVLARVATDPATAAGYQGARHALALAQGESQRIQALFGLQLATASQVAAAKKALDDARTALEAQRQTGAGEGELVLAAPFDGVVTALSAVRGDRLAANAPVLQLGRVDALRIDLGIEPSQHTRVKIGDLASLRPLQSQPSTAGTAPGHAAQGRITGLQYMVDPKTQLISAVVQVPAQAAAELVPGMRVEASIAVGHAEGWVMPRQAVLTDPQGDCIYQVASGTARRVAVQQVAQAQGQVAVEGSIDTTLPVVIAGNYELKDGMKVREASK